MITGFTRHFEKKWIDEFGEDPSVEDINDSLEDAICIQSYSVLYDRRKEDLHNVLAIYWTVADNLIIKVDSESKSAVTYCSQHDNSAGDA